MVSKAAERLNKLRTGNLLLNLGMDVEISENFSKRCFSRLSSENDLQQPLLCSRLHTCSCSPFSTYILHRGLYKSDAPTPCSKSENDWCWWVQTTLLRNLALLGGRMSWREI